MSASNLSNSARRVLLQSSYRTHTKSITNALPAQHHSSLPPTFLLPLRARLTTITTSTTTTDPNPSELAYNHSPSKNTPTYSTPPPPQPQQPPSNRLPPKLSKSHTLSRRAPLPPPTTPNPILLPLLAAQPPHYITAHLHSRPYLLTLGDTLRLPFHMPDAVPGDIIRLNRVSVLGSREYTMRGTPWVDEGCFVCRARVVGVEGEPMRVTEKTVRRRRKVRTLKRKMRFTVLRVCELEVLPEGGGKELRVGEVEGSVMEGEA